MFVRLIKKKTSAHVNVHIFREMDQLHRCSISTINYAMYRKYLLNTKACLSMKILLLALFWQLMKINMPLVYSVNICVFRAACALPFIQHRMGLPYNFPKQGLLTLTVLEFALSVFQNLLQFNLKN